MSRRQSVHRVQHTYRQVYTLHIHFSVTLTSHCIIECYEKTNGAIYRSLKYSILILFSVPYCTDKQTPIIDISILLPINWLRTLH